MHLEQSWVGIKHRVTQILQVHLPENDSISVHTAQMGCVILRS